jgi:cytochrome c-type biogenesis protein CcmH/NrfG
MSPRDTQWFLAGAATGLIAGALGFYLLFGSNTVTSNTVTQNSVAATPPPASTPDLLMPGDRWPTPADANSISASARTDTTHATQAGALDEVTRKLAQRLATQGGSDEDWNLLAQSYDYMGRTEDARAARKHIAKAD